MNFFSSRKKQRSFQESRAVRVELFNFSEKISIFFSFMVQKRVLWHPQFQGYFKNCPYMVYAAPIKTSTKMTLKHSIGMLKNAEKYFSNIHQYTTLKICDLDWSTRQQICKFNWIQSHQKIVSSSSFYSSSEGSLRPIHFNM